MYNAIKNINKLKFNKKKVLLIGAGYMAEQYCMALSAMGIRDVTVCSRTEQSAKKCSQKYLYHPVHGGYELCLPQLGTFDLVIIATPVHDLMPATLLALQHGNRNILVEKPASLYSDELTNWSNMNNDMHARIRVAFNRLTYPNLVKLKELVEKEGGITSCRYTFTERIHTINFNNNKPDCYARWGISNSLHVISMAHFLIGLPQELSCYHCGGLDWHPSGSRFVGSGITVNNVPFSYHADWDSAGRWGIEVMTLKNAYSLIPLEGLNFCPKGTFTWEKVDFEVAYSNVKHGVAELIAVMLDPSLESQITLVNLEQAREYINLAEKICNYSHSE
jgi:predicted dehydrogenase